MNNIKQVIIVRKDLNMRKGKMCAQVAHASMKVFFDRIEMLGTYSFEHGGLCKSDTILNAYNDFTPEMIEWMNSSFTKIVVSCDSEQELFELQKQAEEAGIVNAIIVDNGLTEFKEVCPDCEGRGVIDEITIGKEINIDCEKCGCSGKVNKPTTTCLAIGPDKAKMIDKITGHLKLL